MPSTLVGLLIFVSMLTPGFAYLSRLESRLPGHTYSSLRESAIVVTASAITNAFVLVLFGLFRTAAPGLTPNAGEIVREPGPYFQNHYVAVALWSLVLLLASAGLATVAATPPAWTARGVGKVPGQLGEFLMGVVDRTQRRPILPESAWGAAFHRHPKRRVHLGVRMSDGTYIYGPLASFNPQIDETNDRALVIGAPVLIRTASSDELAPMDADAVIVGAHQIKSLNVHYLPSDAAE